MFQPKHLSQVLFNPRHGANPTPGALPAVLLLALAVLTLPSAAHGADGNTADWARTASFVFAGTIMKVNASNVEQLAASDNLAVVRVDEILKARGQSKKLQGQEITLRLMQPKTASIGARTVFFAKEWLFSDNVAMEEIGEQAMKENDAGLKGAVSTALTTVDDQELKQRLQTADLVVVGKVQDIMPGPAQSSAHVTEHDPKWKNAVVQIDSVEKGTYSQKTIEIQFPTSLDVVFAQYPKFKKDQEGIWILRQNADFQGKPISAYTAFNRLDVQDKASLQHIRDLLKK